MHAGLSPICSLRARLRFGRRGRARETASSALLLASNRVAVKQADQASVVQTSWISAWTCLLFGKGGRNFLLRPFLLQGAGTPTAKAEPRFGIMVVNEFISPITLWLVIAARAQEAAGKSNATKVCAHGSVTHSASAAAKSIPSPTRCLTSLSHARGLVP